MPIPDESPLAELLRRRYGAAAAANPKPELEVIGGTEAGEASGQDSEESPTRFRMHCIELRPLNALWSMPTYAQLIDVLFDGRNPTFIALVFMHQLVIIRGRNLKAIIAGLRMRTQWVIEQTDEQQASTQAKELPVVLSMEFITDNVAYAVAALRESPSG